jgi:XTP/dITP diphosphohydrolase
MGPDPIRLHLASANAHKAAEFQRLADATASAGRIALTIVPAARMPEVVEDTGTFAGNARKKALALREILAPDAWVLADDSGVCVDALDGAPGVESAYYAGPQHDSAANLRKLAAVMRSIPADRRRARFVCVLFLAGPGGVEEIFEGRCEGKMREVPAGGAGFGYDPLFEPEGYDRTYAELSDEEKNKISHRGHAWLRLAEWCRRGGG